jgi:two-component system response regulator NreC
MPPIRVLIADDHAVLRDSLKAFLALFPDIQVIGEASSGIETLNQARQLRPDVVLLDLAMPELGGLDVLRRIRNDLPECKVVILSQYELPDYILPALREGAQGYVLKRASGQEVVQAIRTVANGEAYLHPSIAGLVIQTALLHSGHSSSKHPNTVLTEREKDVLALIGEGKTNSEIAQILSISTKTVDKHRASLMRKLGISTRAGLIKYALLQK